ncbi:MAG: alpha-1,2-fucosyltransferase [Candidatus Paceibacterota bacterium]|jgi:hypothetical protein
MIIVKLKGGMGNQMFQYALGRALSLKYNVPLGFDLSFLLNITPRLNFTFRNYDLDIFNIKADIVPSYKIPLMNKVFKGKIGRIFDYLRRLLSFDRGIEKYPWFKSSILHIGPNAYLDGYWQSYKYFEDIADIIREDFTLKNKLSLNIENLKEEINNCSSLCIHVRRGDYVGNKYHEIVGKDYYEQGIKKIETLVTIDKIYVFSDDIKWCEDNMKFSYSTMFVGEEFSGEKGEGHMFLMSQCKYFVIPNSSFSWWGAWLSNYKNKIVIVPKKWFPWQIINKSDIAPKEWIKI